MVIEKGGEDLVNVKKLAGKAVEEADAIMAKMSAEELKTPY
jgi:hypothetical protein